MRVHLKWQGVFVFGMCLQSILFAETVGVFYDNTVPQIQFAAGDVKTALVAKGFTVEQLALSTLSSGYANKKVVIALKSNNAVTGLLTSQEGSTFPSLGEEAYALRTTTKGEVSYWVIGGDVSGAMYGGLQVAENISFEGYGKSYNTEETPYMASRGLKLNMPLDRRLPTYGSFTSASSKLAIPHVWDTTFWKNLIDQQSRARYNFLSVWVSNPFPALVQVAEYPKTNLPYIEGFNGYIRADLTHTKRVEFWRFVMKYAADRGMKFYFFNWNIDLEYAGESTGLTETRTDAGTIDYFYKSMYALISTYPDLAGFGISAGDAMGEAREGFGTNTTLKTQWTWNAMGKAVYDYLKANPDRKFNLIHRMLGSTLVDVETEYAPLRALPNATLDFSVKYSNAHMYSTPSPKWYSYVLREITPSNIKTYLTVRNDDMHYLHWGDPKFVRDFMDSVENKPAVKGLYIGTDGGSPTKTFLYKDNSLNTMFEYERRWYMETMWGRISYNIQTSDQTFKLMLKKRYSNITNTENLFTAWSLASRGITKGSEMLIRDWHLDTKWWPEIHSGQDGFKTIDDYGTATPANGSHLRLCSIASTANNNCGKLKSSLAHADEILSEMKTALSLANTLGSGVTNEEKIAITNIRQMAYIGGYIASKIKGATYKLASKTVASKGDSAKACMADAYCFWMAYTTSMNSLYIPLDVRTMEITKWNFADSFVLKEYQNTGKISTDTPVCQPFTDIRPAKPLGLTNKGVISIHSFSSRGIQFVLPEKSIAAIKVFNIAGKVLFQEKVFNGNKGLNEVLFSKKHNPGLHFVEIKAGGQSVSGKFTFVGLK